MATHIPGIENIEADYLSRIDPAKEWSLPKEIFEIIQKEFGQLKVDLFASRLNNKLPEYASWLPDPNAKYIDAFSFTWPNQFYAFPPFSLSLRVAHKAFYEGCTGVLVTPEWAAQPWFGLLTKKTRKRLRLPNVTLNNPASGESLNLDLVVWQM